MAGWHEDFGDEPSVEERYPDDDNGRNDDWFGYEDYDRERHPEEYDDDDGDGILERQEMEDFEGLNGPFEDREFDGE